MNKLLILLAASIARTVDGWEGEFGANLSGGIDSSSVVRVTQDLGYEFPTFTGYYDGAAYDEREYARLVASPDHHEILITPDDFVSNFDHMCRHLTPPIQGPGTFGQFMVARHIAECTTVKLVLSGEGGDELFGGYARLLRVAGEPLPDGYESYQQPTGYPTNLEDALAYDFSRLGDLLAVDDQVLHAWGLKGRAPFTDQALIDWVLRQPATSRVGKRLLKSAMHNIVPSEILTRTDKKGFPVPFVEWAQREPVKSFVADRIGYVPDPEKPWDRRWWNSLVGGTMAMQGAAV